MALAANACSNSPDIHVLTQDGLHRNHAIPRRQLRFAPARAAALPAEQEAATMNEILGSQTEASWEQIAPQLDDALHELSKEDRDAAAAALFSTQVGTQGNGLGARHQFGSRAKAREAARWTGLSERRSPGAPSPSGRGGWSWRFPQTPSTPRPQDWQRAFRARRHSPGQPPQPQPKSLL